MADPLLEVRDLRTYIYTRRGIVKAVDGASFSVHAGETLGIVGESGSGKSMSCLSILQLVPEPGRPTLLLRVAEANAMRAVEVLAPFRDRGAELGLVSYVDWEALPETGYPACPACEPSPPIRHRRCPRPSGWA